MKSGLQVIEAMTKTLVTVSAETSVLECAKLMQEEHLGSILVTKKDSLLGIITEQDIVYKVTANKSDPSKVKAQDIMSKNIISISPDADINEAMLKMSRLSVRRLPVVSEGKLVGMITSKDILKVEPQLFEIIVEKIELREEKNKPIYKIGEREGVCNLCGNYSKFLFDQDDVLVCEACLE